MGKVSAMKSKICSETLVDAVTDPYKMVYKERLQKHFYEMNIIFRQLPYKIYLIDIADYRVLATNCNGTISKSGNIPCCHNMRYSLDRPCHVAGMVCPLEIVKNTKRPTKSLYVTVKSEENLYNNPTTPHPNIP